MKRLLLISGFVIFYSCAYSFLLIDKWLEKSTVSSPHFLFYNDSLSIAMVESLNTAPISLNFGNCITEMQTELVDSLPVIQNGGENNSGSFIVKYLRKYVNSVGDTLDLPEDNYGKTILPALSGNDKTYESFTIYLNDSTKYPWNIAGGGSTGGVDINTILRHEIGHSLALDEEHNTALLTLMSDGIVQANNNYQELHIGNQEIWGLRAIYDPPLLSIDGSNIIEFGDSIIFNAEGPIDIRLMGNAGFHGYIQKNSDIYTSDPHFIKCSDDYYVDTLYTYVPDEIGEYKFKIYTAMAWNENAYLSWYDEYYNRPFSEVSFKVVAAPKIESPLPNEIYPTRPSGGKGITDTLAIKVRVPEVLGSYPDINIKIDDVYVNQGDISFDSGENVWVYYWDLSAETPTEYGRRYNIVAEIDGDPTDFDATGIYLVEAIYFEDFQTMTSLVSAGWYVHSWETPELPYVGWWLDVDAFDYSNICALTYSQHSYTLTYSIESPLITLPAVSDESILLKYKVFYAELESIPPFSTLYFTVFDSEGSALRPVAPVAAIKDQWVEITYDLTEFAGQSISLYYHNYYSSSTETCNYTVFLVNDILVSIVPDISSPNIDFIAGNTADIDEDMNLTLQFNDASNISSVTADYSIESDSDTITLYPVKGTYNYTGTILARDHECNGTISFKIKDSVGNETISSLYSINWVAGGGYVLSAPENVIFSAENDSTAVITWDIVPGATGYKVYSSLDPYGTFAEDSTGTFTESRKWEKAFEGSKYFYYIIATDGAKEEVFLENNEDESAVLPLSIKQLRSIR